MNNSAERLTPELGPADWWPRIKAALQSQPAGKPLPEGEVDAAYKFWRVRIMLTMFVGYAIFYFCRKNLSMALPALEMELGISKTDLGWVLTFTNFFYGLSKFVNGMIADHANPRYFMAIGLIASACMNVFFGMSSMFWTLSVAWILNGWFQGMGWPPCARQLTHWYHVSERGTWWGVWNASHQFGGAGIFVLAGYLVQEVSWRAAFFAPAAIAVCVAIWMMWSMRDTPESLGLPSIDQYKGDHDAAAKADDEADESFKEIMTRYVLKNKMLWIVCAANFFVYIVRMGVMDWAPTMLYEMKGSSMMKAGLKVAGFEITGIFGALAAGWLSDRVFRSNRGKVNVLFMFGVMATFYLFWNAAAGSWIEISGLALVGFFIYGPQMLVGVSAADFASKRAAATATGLTGLFGYLGASVIAGVVTGWVVEQYGWQGGFYLFMGSAIIGTALFMLTWSTKARQ